MSQEKHVPSTSNDDATLPPPRAHIPATLGGQPDATLVSPPPAPTQLHAAAAGQTTAGPQGDVTLAQQLSGGPTVDATLPLGKAPVFEPTDATLNHDDPHVKEFHESAQHGAKGPAITTGASFGHYELIAPIAKGGMGIVYKARQRNLNRVVAIKMILAGQFADQTDVDRFYAEAEAAAALSHPNIVAIHEIGEVQGQHFFSMDYVEGQSLAGLVQESPLPPRRAAELLITIAETMQFAHDSGIIHRDLKPSNVLLDKKQRPLITDFGLAKQVSNQSQITIAGGVVGTPSYMPPEQAQGKGDEVGPLSDLYSLGAILYECLTGRPPFRAATPFETIRQVIETEPVSPRLVNPGLPRDLETICLKCLQKEKPKRYTSAQELADELGRFIRGEPIHARPISKAARFWRLCKRNPVMSTTIAAALLALVVATGVSTGFYIRTAKALVRETAALTESKESLRRESAALVKSDKFKNHARETVRQFFTSVSENKLINQPGMQPLRNELLKMAKEYYEELLKEESSDPDTQAELADAYYRLGKIAELLDSLDDAQPWYEKAREIQQRLVDLRPDDKKFLAALGATLNVQGTIWVQKSDYTQARKKFDEAAQIREKLAADVANMEYQRELANTHMNIGMLEVNSGSLTEARKHFEHAQEIRLAALKLDSVHKKLRRDLGMGYYNLSNIDMAEENNSQAETHLKKAAAVWEALTAEPPSDLDNERSLAVTYRRLGDVLSDDRAAERRQYYQQALARLKPLALENPAVVDYQMDRAGLFLVLYDLELSEGNSPAARIAIEQARDIYAALVERFPDEGWCKRDLAVALRELARVQDTAGESGAASKNLAEAIRILEELVSGNPQEAEYAEALVDTKAVMLTAGPR